MNDIINILRLEDESVNVIDITITGDTRTISLEKKLEPVYSPSCSCRMYSRGKKIRTVNHPIFQDGLKTILKVYQRRWRCNMCGVSLPKHSRSSTNTNTLPISQISSSSMI